MFLVLIVSIPVRGAIFNVESLRHESGIERGCQQLVLLRLDPSEPYLAFVLVCETAVVLEGSFIIESIWIGEQKNPRHVILRCPSPARRDQLIVQLASYLHDLAFQRLTILC